MTNNRLSAFQKALLLALGEAETARVHSRKAWAKMMLEHEADRWADSSAGAMLRARVGALSRLTYERLNEAEAIVAAFAALASLGGADAGDVGQVLDAGDVGRVLEACAIAKTHEGPCAGPGIRRGCCDCDHCLGTCGCVPGRAQAVESFSLAFIDGADNG